MQSNVTRSILAACLALASPALAATLHVPADHPTIQSCIDAAISGQDECLVAPGTYNELINFLGKAITLRSSDGPEVTIIDGTDLGGSVVQIKNHETRETIFEGFTVTGGTGTNSAGTVYGGGMYLSVSSPIVRNSVFTANSAKYGGGIYCDGHPQITNCAFSNNTADFGGGLAALQGGNLEITECIFQGNVATGRGGGLYTQLATARIERCQFTQNNASVGGGMRNSSSTVAVIDSDFIDNTALFTGGGIAGGDPGFLSTASQLTFDIYEIRGGYFQSNKALGLEGRGGGAVFDNGRSTIISSARFVDNQGHWGGEILAGGSAAIVGCHFLSNRAGENGGAVRAADFGIGSTSIADSYFDGNTAAENGGAVWGADSVEMSTFTNNLAGGDGGAVCHELDNPGFVSRSSFSGNSGLRGGAVFGSFDITKCVFVTNAAINSGGALYGMGADSSVFLGNESGESGGAIYLDGVARVLDSLFSGNSATFGGALYNAGTVSVYGTTFVANHAFGSGGAVSNLGMNATGNELSLVNSILWGNLAPKRNQIWIDADALNTTVRSCDFEDSGGSANWDTWLGIDQGGNIDLNPGFVRMPDDGDDDWGDDPSTPNIDESANDDFGDLRLQPGSPCINTGDPSYPSFEDDTDVDGHPRVLCGRVDMGAYEFGIGDYDCNQSVNLADLAAWATCATDPAAVQLTIANPKSEPGAPATGGSSEFGNWQFDTPTPKPGARNPIPGCESFDFDADGDIDLSDLSQFLLVATP